MKLMIETICLIVTISSLAALGTIFDGSNAVTNSGIKSNPEKTIALSLLDSDRISKRTLTQIN